jgi:hypothetical protein
MVTTTQIPPAVAVRRPTASYRMNLVTVLLGTWLTVGLMLDAWAHNNIPQLETFFTPWHAVFYSGFFVTAAWILWNVREPFFARRFTDIPAGYGAAVVGIGLFALSAAGDMTWHLVFGIEQNVKILFSPTHLGLGASMVTILLAPLRSAWANRSEPATPSIVRLLPAVLSIAMATTVTLLFLQYGNAFDHGSGDIAVGLSDIQGGGQQFIANLVSDIAITNLVLLLPVLAVARRWVPPFGTATIVYAATAGLSVAITGFENVELMIGVVVAGLGVDLLIRYLRPSPDRLLQFRILAAAAPLLTWTVFIVTAFVTSPPFYDPAGNAHAVPELVTGVPVVQALIGLAIGFFLIPARQQR